MCIVERMTTDEEFVRQRAQDDEHAYLINTTDYEIAPRLAPATRALRDALQDAGPGGLPWATAVASGLRASDVAVKTLDNLVRKMINQGLVLKRGEYTRRYNRQARQWVVSDSRRLSLGEWPLPGAPS